MSAVPQSERFRKQAEEADRLARQMVSAVEREAMTKIAEQWRVMEAEALKREGKWTGD